MEDYYERLTVLLLEKNTNLTYAQARTWIELLWEDFETTQPKRGESIKEKKQRKKWCGYG